MKRGIDETPRRWRGSREADDDEEAIEHWPGNSPKYEVSLGNATPPRHPSQWLASTAEFGPITGKSAVSRHGAGPSGAYIRPENKKRFVKPLLPAAPPKHRPPTARPTPITSQLDRRRRGLPARPQRGTARRRADRPKARCWCWPAPAPARPASSPPASPTSSTTGRARGSEILSVTFTNKAAREMKERIGRLVGATVEGMPWLGTFHSIGARILRRHAELVGLKSDFTILDTDDQIRLIKQLLEAENIDEKRWPARQFAGMMDNWKNRGLLPKDVTPGEAGSLRQWPRQAALRRLPGPPQIAERRRFRRPAARKHPPVPRAPRRPRRVPPPLQIHPRRRVPGQQRRAVSLAAPPRPGQARERSQCLRRRRRRPVDLWLARRRGRQHPALREGLSRRQGHQARTQLPLDLQHPPHRLPPHRPQRIAPGQDPADRRRRGRRQGRRHPGLGQRGGSPPDRRRDRAAPAPRQRPQRHRHPRPRLLPDARIRRALHHAGPQLSRHRRPALLRAPRNPRRPRLSPPRRQPGRRPRLRAHRQHPQARHRRLAPSASSTKPPAPPSARCSARRAS